MFTHNDIRYFSDNDGAVRAAKVGADGWLPALHPTVAIAVRQAETAASIAMGYAWGAQDNGLRVTSEQLDAFRHAYACHAFDYYCPNGGAGVKTNVRDALAHFLAGRRLDGRAYPVKTSDGRTVWACCESSIGPTCEHGAS